MIPFEKASYLAQVRRLRKLAETALTRYSISVKSIRFINHGENTTFCVTDKKGRKFLLRIHRAGYHTQEAIQEELDWLSELSMDKDSSFLIPKPVKSKNGLFIESVGAPGVQTSRFCCVFHWVDGWFFKKSISPSHLFKLGQMTAKLHLAAKGKTVKHRNYWSAAGLLGLKPKLGSIDRLMGISKKDQETITRERLRIYKKLRAFEKKYPERQGFIHADLHFGNVLLRDGKLGAIDFDDCGFGFHAYDLAVPLTWLKTFLERSKRYNPNDFKKFKEALLTGYSSLKKWDNADEDIFHEFLLTRKLAMLGWIQSRSDNPRLKKYLKTAVKEALGDIRLAN